MSAESLARHGRHRRLSSLQYHDRRVACEPRARRVLHDACCDDDWRGVRATWLAWLASTREQGRRSDRDVHLEGRGFPCQQLVIQGGVRPPHPAPAHSFLRCAAARRLRASSARVANARRLCAWSIRVVHPRRLSASLSCGPPSPASHARVGPSARGDVLVRVYVYNAPVPHTRPSPRPSPLSPAARPPRARDARPVHNGRGA